ncbi:MAG TPA: succinyldiaminopimelate transaminase [Acidimicrobiia bacterium]|nr:succinyldiaminopimelate transaminase [Acidimicrobiia bacterium]
MSGAPSGGFVPPPYPYDRLRALEARAAASPAGLVDCSVGTPCDPVPALVADAITAALPEANGYPASAGSPEYRAAAAGWITRRFGVEVTAEHVAACVGTKELVASLPHALHLRDPGRDTVLFPAVAYPTYAMGATLAGLRAVPVPVDDHWHLALDHVADADAERALVLWLNEPGNPTSAVADDARFAATVAWARERGIVVASDECYVEFAPDPATVLSAGTDGVLAVHSLSKRSNLAGMRAGFYAGDPALVAYLVEVRKHAGLMVPAPVQAGAVAALGDQQHVHEQRARYEERRALVADALTTLGVRHDGGPMPFYLWLRADDGRDGWAMAESMAQGGLLVAPGEFYGDAGADHARLALVQPRDALERALDALHALVTH